MNVTKNFFKSHLADESDSYADRGKFIRNRIKIVEKFMPDFAKSLSDYNDKNAKSRDCSDKISTILNEYSKAEKVTNIFKSQIGEIANVLQEIGASRDAYVCSLKKVSEQVSDCNAQCKQVKQDLKLSQVAHEREKYWSRQLKRAKESNPQDCQQISLAEEEFLKARGEANKLTSVLDEQMDIFERKRLSGMKEALLSWATAELRFHAKALELFTEAYRIASEIDVNSDLEKFRSKLNDTEDTFGESFQRSDSILRLISLPFQKKTKFTGQGIPHPSSTLSSFHSSRSSNISF